MVGDALFCGNSTQGYKASYGELFLVLETTIFGDALLGMTFLSRLKERSRRSCNHDVLRQMR